MSALDLFTVLAAYVLWNLPPLWSVATDPEVSGSIPRRYWIFWEVVGLERSPLSLVSTIE
jgi:hypothetical protein